MSLSYTIENFNEATGSIIVSYANNGIKFARYNVDIPLDENNLFIVGEQLQNHIMGLFPLGVLSRMEALKNGIANASEIQALVVTSQTSTSEPANS